MRLHMNKDYYLSCPHLSPEQMKKLEAKLLNNKTLVGLWKRYQKEGIPEFVAFSFALVQLSNMKLQPKYRETLLRYAFELEKPWTITCWKDGKYVSNHGMDIDWKGDVNQIVFDFIEKMIPNFKQEFKRFTTRFGKHTCGDGDPAAMDMVCAIPAFFTDILGFNPLFDIDVFWQFVEKYKDYFSDMYWYPAVIGSVQENYNVIRYIIADFNYPSHLQWRITWYEAMRHYHGETEFEIPYPFKK